MTHTHKPPSRRARQAGFTLIEVLLTGVIGAVLLTSVTYATLSFSLTVAHLEKEAGITTADDVVMRRITRDIREAWWAEVVDSSHLKLADNNGDFLEYLLEDGNLVQIRTDGTEGIMLEDIEQLVFEEVIDERLRESTTQTTSGTWMDSQASGPFSFAYEMPEGAELAVGFSAPVNSEDVPSSGVTEEQVLDVSAEVLSIPVAWIPGSDDEDLQVQVFATRGPGLAQPRGNALGTLTIPGSSLPLAVLEDEDDDDYETPSDMISVSLTGLGVDFKPGAGYALVLTATGDARLVLKCFGNYPDDTDDLMAVSDGSPGSNWVDVPLAMPCTLSGQYSLTSTHVDNAVTSISITLTPAGRPTQTRSAAVLSQTVSESPWYGVLPGEEAP